MKQSYCLGMARVSLVIVVLALGSNVDLIDSAADPTAGMISAVSFGFILMLLLLCAWFVLQKTRGLEQADLPFKFPFAIHITLGWRFIFVSLFMTWLTLGKEAMKPLFKRFFLWRVGWMWYIVATLLMPALRFAAIPLTACLTGVPADYSHPMTRDLVPLDWPLLFLVLPWILFEVFTNGEEMGWRGYVLPR